MFSHNTITDYQMIVSNDLIIKSFDTGFHLSVWLSKGLIIKPKSSTIKSINTQKKGLRCFSQVPVNCFSDVWMNWFFSKNTFHWITDYVNDISKISTNVCVPHMRKGTTHRDGNLLGKWSIILSLKLVSMTHSMGRRHNDRSHEDRTPVLVWPIIVTWSLPQ